MKFILSAISVVLFLLPNLALGTSYGEPLPSVEANSLTSYVLFNLAISLYVLAFASYFAMIFTAKKNLATLGRNVTLIAIALHASGYLLRWKELYDHGWGRFPLSSLYEALIIYCLMLAAISLYLRLRSQREIVASFFLPIVIVLLLLANTTQSAGISALYDPRYSSDLELIKFTHRLEVLQILLLTAGYCLLTTAGVASLLLVVANISARKSNINTLFPPAETLYDWNKKAMKAGTVLFILGFIIGLFWEKKAWGIYWSWAPNEMLLALTLITYSFFTLRNIWQGWYKRKAINRSIIGLIIVVITYIIAQSIISGLLQSFISGVLAALK